MKLDKSNNNKRIAKNTAMLYVRSIIILVVSLYTSRVVLQALGIVDYGIYTVVGSLVSTFSLFSATFSSATQRFLNFEMGRGNALRLKEVFSASVNIYIILAGVILLLLETIGLWFLNTNLTIPNDRLFAANIVYQLSIIAFVVNLISVPYDSVIIANERMGIFAYVSIYQAVSKLAIAISISYIAYDNLILFSLLLVIVSISVRLFYGWYCKWHFTECRRVTVSEKIIYKSMLTLSGWNFLGAGASILIISGVPVIINFFTNVAVNSAKGISGQIENAVRMLLSNFMVALKPQITKAYASGNQDYLFSLISKGTRFSFVLTWLLCLPIICVTDVILKLWLAEVPQYTLWFVRLSLIALITFPLSTILDMLLMASGKIRTPQIVLSFLQILNIPFICVVLLLGFPPYYIYIPIIVITMISFVCRLHFSVKVAGLSLILYKNEIITPIFISVVVVLSLILPIWSVIYNGTIVEAFITVLFVELVLSLCLWFVVLKKTERKLLKDLFLNKIRM